MSSSLYEPNFGEAFYPFYQERILEALRKLPDDSPAHERETQLRLIAQVQLHLETDRKVYVNSAMGSRISRQVGQDLENIWSQIKVEQLAGFSDEQMKLYQTLDSMVRTLLVYK